VSLRIDHVVYAVRDLHEAATSFEDAHGLVAVPGGVHPLWGTGNRIIPLGDRRYIELIAIIDPAIAATTALGRAIAERTTGGDGWFALCLADDAIETTAARLGLVAERGSRTLPDGRAVAWRGAGIDDARRTPDLPFFIEWAGDPEAHPGARAVEHPSGASGIAWIEIAGDPVRFASWTGDDELPVRFVDGAPGVVAVALSTPAGEVVIR
jgi:glyoxalase-like protein